MLDWVAGPGFNEYFERLDFNWHTSQQFRQRYLIAAMRGMQPFR